MNKCDFYIQSLDDINKPKDKNLVVKFEFQLSPSLKKSLYTSDIFTKDELKSIDTGLKKQQNIKCKSLQKKLIELKILNNTDNVSEYSIVNYSNPIKVGNSKVYLFLDKLFMEDNRGIKGGASVLQIFKKTKAGWNLDETKILEFY